MATRPIFDVCAKETGYEGGGRLWVLWWIQKAAEDQLRVTVEAIWQKLGCGGDRNPPGVTGVRKGQRGGAQKARSMVVVGGIDILGRRQVTPRYKGGHPAYF